MSQKPNILLIVPDMLRRNAADTNGYLRARAPRLNAWVHEGLRFPRRRCAQADWVLPAPRERSAREGEMP